MDSHELNSLRFPIGQLELSDVYSEEDRKAWSQTIRELPEQLSALVSDLNETELGWVYRPDGWNIRQLVHHLADSHLNAFVRFKLTLTEATPRIRPYHEASWAETKDVSAAPIEDSLAILKGLHHRWSILLDHMDREDFDLEYLHPEYNREFSLFEALATYNWHSKHHIAHIHLALEAKGKYN